MRSVANNTAPGAKELYQKKREEKRGKNSAKGIARRRTLLDISSVKQIKKFLQFFSLVFIVIDRHADSSSIY